VSLSFDTINWMQVTIGENGRHFFDFFSAFGGPYGWLLFVPLVFWLAGSKAGLRVAFTVSVSMIANTLLKWSFANPRPYYLTDQVQAMKATSGLGMPSGHAQGVAAQWCTLAYFLRHRWCVWLAVAFILATGASRVYFGVHTPGQVAIGWTLGLLTVVATVWLEAPVVRWIGSKSIATQVSSTLVVGGLIILTGYVIAIGLRGDFNPPPEWQTRWQATVDRLVAEGNLSAGKPEFKLIDPTQIIGMGCLFIGFSFCGLWLLRTGEINPGSDTHRMTNVVLGMPLLAALALVLKPQLDSLVGEVASVAALGITIPSCVGVVFPSFTARLFSHPK
jgi:membrane-associated phospholipid phosphatase